MPNQSFSYTGNWVKFNVPSNVKILELVATGGGTASAQAGRVQGKLKVDEDNVLWVLVGRSGHNNAAGAGGGSATGGGGRGGDGAGGGYPGGEGGGGATIVRLGKKDGPLRLVAGGAGGESGDGGDGGDGGAASGQFGAPGPAQTNTIGNATGGTQAQGGKGGNSPAGTAFDGKNGQNVKTGDGGRGAGTGLAKQWGGGGGGGGYYPGGGGAAGLDDFAPGGGGAGGSNFVGPLYAFLNGQGNGGHGDGSLTITWETPGGNEPPTAANNITIDTKPAADALATKATSEVMLRGDPNDPNDNQDVRLLVRLSTKKNFSNWTAYKGTYDDQEEKDKVHLTGLQQNTRYWVRVHTQDARGKISDTYSSTNFWMNRSPDPPALTLPPDNGQFDTVDNVTFQWNHSDPDPSDSQTQAQLRWRKAEGANTPPGAWRVPIVVAGATESYVAANNNFSGNTFYEWTVRTRDEQNKYGVWATPKSFYINAVATPPILLEPINDEAFPAADEQLFRWKFKGPQNDVAQTRLDIEYRVVGTESWTTIFGEVDPGLPGTSQFWTLPADTFGAKEHYEWRAKSYTSLGDVSDWSESAFFWTTDAPGSGAGIEIFTSETPQAHLGEGDNRVFIYDRGGTILRGEITGFSKIVWHRKRDDISDCTITINQWDEGGREFLKGIRCWLHEVVVFRDGKRVWEGPVTLTSSNSKGMTVQAKDVMAYVYRRIMRQGYNDAYRIVNGTQLGLKTVVQRSTKIILNALAYDDPNVLAYMTPMHFAGDAKNSRIRADYSRTAWEEVDDLAATAGLDYTVSGRRIVLWDTHRPIGRLPEMRDGDFSEEPVIAGYGMSMANYFGVTNNNGIWGKAERAMNFRPTPDPYPGLPGPEGWIEMLASSYGESEGAGTEQTLTKEARKRLEQSMSEQAERNIAGRYPEPIVVRVPDNATLMPELNIGINQLIPGVWIPLRSSGGVRDLSQWQKLDSMTVTQDGSGEKVSVVMSPAPNEGNDPDADQAVEEEGAG